jgi:tetratricopeptide (TPR) repeat protein
MPKAVGRDPSLASITGTEACSGIGSAPLCRWAIVALLLTASRLVMAADPILEQIEVLPDPKGSLVRIELNTPVQLISHTPQRNGDLLQIQIQPILIRDDAELNELLEEGRARSTLAARSRVGLFARQTLLWSPSAAVPLVEVTYDGGGLQLIEPPALPAIPGRDLPQDFVRRPAKVVGTAEILLRFNRTVFYEVQRDPNPRFLRVVVLGAPAGEVTLPPTEEIPQEGVPGTDDTGVPRTREAPAPGVEQPPPPPEEGAALPAPAPAAAGTYVVNLASSVEPFTSAEMQGIDVPADRRLYTTTFEKDGKTWQRLRLGFFADAESAREALNALRSAYPEAWVAQASDAERRAAGAAAPAPEPAPMEPAPAAEVGAVVTGPPPTGGAASAVEQARQALIDKDYDTAIGLLSRELEDPNTRFRLEAQELLGVARERKGQLALAKAEYERYLELNPDGENAARVQQRLDGLITADQALREKLRLSKQEQVSAAPGAPAAAETEIYGGFSQFYRRENQFLEGQGTDPVQSGLQNDLDLNARRRGENVDLQGRFSGGYLYDFLDNGPEPETRISTLFVDAQDKERNLQARLGRQSSTTGGVLGRFDGGLLGVRLSDWARLNFVGGCPVESSVNRAIHCEKAFYGANIDLGTFWDAVDFNVFAIEQDFDDILDRRSVGAEMRYFKPDYSVFTLVDYDISYDELNTFLLLANYVFQNQATVNLIVDHRTTPLLTTANSLQGQLVDSLDALREFYTEDQIRDLAEDRTAISDAVTLGGSYPLNERFLVNGDLTLTSISGTDGSIGLNGAPDVASTSRTGVEKIYSLQLIGSSLFKPGDTSIAGVRFSDLEESDTASFLLNTRYPVTDRLRVNPLLQFDHTSSDDGSEDWVVEPQLLVNYRVMDRMQIEFETGAQWALLGDPVSDSVEFLDYFASIGYRYDF